MKLRIGHLYPDLLNLYGDRGNIQCMMKRCQWRGIEAETVEFALEDSVEMCIRDRCNTAQYGFRQDPEAFCSLLRIPPFSTPAYAR